MLESIYHMIVKLIKISILYIVSRKYKMNKCILKSIFHVSS